MNEGQKVWAVSRWDEEPAAIFSSHEKARIFVEAQPDYEERQLAEDGTGHDCYPFITEYWLDQLPSRWQNAGEPAQRSATFGPGNRPDPTQPQRY